MQLFVFVSLCLLSIGQVTNSLVFTPISVRTTRRLNSVSPKTEFIGCYIDQKPRTLNEKMISSSTMTVGSCRKSCTDLGFRYYGVEYSIQCFCGNQLTSSRKMNENHCLSPCSGDKGQTCGGVWRIAVYENPQHKPVAIERKEFVGCYMDQETRLLNEKMISSSTMTVGSCRKSCTDLGFRYYGVEYSVQCFCGNKLTEIWKLKESECLKPCAGDKTQGCGGVWRIAVYENPHHFPEFVGCYMDQEARTLNGKMISSSTMTVGSCRKSCTDLGFRYYGVEVCIRSIESENCIRKSSALLI